MKAQRNSYIGGDNLAYGFTEILQSLFLYSSDLCHGLEFEPFKTQDNNFSSRDELVCGFVETSPFCLLAFFRSLRWTVRERRSSLSDSRHCTTTSCCGTGHAPPTLLAFCRRVCASPLLRPQWYVEGLGKVFPPLWFCIYTQLFHGYDIVCSVF